MKSVHPGLVPNTASTRRIPKLRWGIGVLLGVGVLINYFDRINLSVAAPQLQHEFGLTDGELGWLFSGFFWSYALLQIPTGMILDRFGVTWVNRISTFLWSVMSAAAAFAGGFGGILGARILLGVAEAPGFPASSKATGYWFPRQERALAIRHYRSSEFCLFHRLLDHLPRSQQTSAVERGRARIYSRGRGDAGVAP